MQSAGTDFDFEGKRVPRSRPVHSHRRPFGLYRVVFYIDADNAPHLEVVIAGTPCYMWSTTQKRESDRRLSYRCTGVPPLEFVVVCGSSGSSFLMVLCRCTQPLRAAPLAEGQGLVL